MSAKKSKRDVPVLFWVSDAEMEAIQQKMAQFGTKNLSAYLRKMACTLQASTNSSRFRKGP